jgi:Ca2+/H+ antiporter, TMEM165/GDT1 family
VRVNTLGLGRGAHEPTGFGETFGIGSLHPVGRRELCQGLSPARPNGICMEAFLVSTVVVGLAEIGDKTQILSLMLATHFQRPLPIIFGIFVATIANHSAAGVAGTYFGSLLSGPWMRSILGVSFLSVAIWALFPDKYEGKQDGDQSLRGVYFDTRRLLRCRDR